MEEPRQSAVMTQQDSIFAFMGDASSHDPAPHEVQRIDTHAAVIFLAGSLAYKIKRDVRLSYLDFSTLEKRRVTCEREVEINQITAPDIYLGVIPIVRGVDGGLSIGGVGEPVEWAVKMRRFGQDGLFDVLARNGKLPLELMPSLAHTISGLHRRAEKNRSVDGVSSMARIVASILRSLAKAPPLLDAAKVKALTRALRSALRAGSALIDERTRKGYVRRCHGDLHLRNIVLIEGQPVLFDAIEFDEEIATVDILYDLAFLLMDLHHRGLKAHANVLFNAYLSAPGKRAPLVPLRGLGLMPLFLAARAGVRAMVTLDRLPFVKGAERRAAKSELTEFFDLAILFLEPPPPRLIAVGGLSGTGKSTLAAALAPEVGAAPGAVVVRSDVERKRFAGVAETVRLGCEHYSSAATARVYRAFNAKAQAALETGHSVILDGVFAREDQRARARDIAEKANVPFTGLWLEAPGKQLVERVDARRGDASDADAGIVQKQLGYETGNISWQKIDAGGKPEGVRKRALKALKPDKP